MPIDTNFSEFLGDINKMANALNTADEGAPVAKRILQAAAVPVETQMKSNAILILNDYPANPMALYIPAQ